MPVYTHERPVVPNRDQLVDLLATELAGRASAAADAPQIYEDEVSQTRSVHVLVIWDRWQGVPPVARGPIIYDAYERTDPARVQRVRFAVGFTFDEAVTGGYLPYKVEGLFRAGDPVDRAAVGRAMLSLGARQTPTGLELRFPYRTLADQAIDRLESEFGRGFFAIAQEVGEVGRWARA